MSRSDAFSVGANPVPEVTAATARFRRIMGMHQPEQDYSRSVIPLSQSRAIGRAYMAMPAFDQRAVPAYRQMAEEVGRQFDFMTRPRSRGGLGLSVETEHDDPYGFTGTNFNPARVMAGIRHDVTENNRIKVLHSATTGGHPVFTDDQNNMFRAVHDVFGHLGSGRGVDMHGEDAAYQAHAAMFSPQARPALATETRGQQGALHLTGDFQDQKIGILPARFQVPRNLSPAQFGELSAAREDARFENRKQGLA